jgi:hypothetical protein
MGKKESRIFKFNFLRLVWAMQEFSFSLEKKLLRYDYKFHKASNRAFSFCGRHHFSCSEWEISTGS